MVRLASGRKLSTSSQPYARALPELVLLTHGFRASPPTHHRQSSPRSCEWERATCRDIRDTTDWGEICIIWLPDWPTSASPIGVPTDASSIGLARAIGMRKGPPVKIFSIIAPRAYRPDSDPRICVPICPLVRVPVCTRVLRYRRTLRRLVTVIAEE